MFLVLLDLGWNWLSSSCLENLFSSHLCCVVWQFFPFATRFDFYFLKSPFNLPLFPLWYCSLALSHMNHDSFHSIGYAIEFEVRSGRFKMLDGTYWQRKEEECNEIERNLLFFIKGMQVLLELFKILQNSEVIIVTLCRLFFRASIYKWGLRVCLSLSLMTTKLAKYSLWSLWTAPKASACSHCYILICQLLSTNNDWLHVLVHHNTIHIRLHDIRVIEERTKVQCINSPCM